MMEPGKIVFLISWLITASVMVTVGISQYTARNPVTFYTGEKALARKRFHQ